MTIQYPKTYIYTMPKRLLRKKGIYEFITNLYNTFDFYTNCKIILDSTSTRYMDPAIMAPLGLVLTKFKSKRNLVYFKGLKPLTISHLVFFEFISRPTSIEYISQHTIKYNTFNSNNFNEFKKYLKDSLIELDNDILNDFISYLSELFENVKMHSGNKKNRFKNKEIFTCGYYDTELDYVVFSICNNGNSFKKTIDSIKNFNFQYEYEYIEWALQYTNSTRNQDTPGGLGLPMLYELVENSNGTLIIVSGKGYVEYNFNSSKNNIIKCDFSSPYPGTIITINIPISNMKIYLNNLKNNYSDEDIVSASDLLKENF